MAITTPNFLRGNTPAPGQPINTKSFGNLSDASTAARNAPRTDVFGIQAAGGFIAFPAAVVARSGTTGSYPWHLYNTTTGTTGQVQVNGGDGQVAQLNGFVCNVNGNPSDTQTGMPPAYPQLSVTGNGYIYAKATPTTAGTASPLTSLDLTFQTSVQAQDTSNPAAYYWMLVATISNYAVDGSGNVSFTVNNATGSGYGYSILYYCNGVIGVY